MLPDLDLILNLLIVLRESGYSSSATGLPFSVIRRLGPNLRIAASAVFRLCFLASVRAQDFL